jgi:hypothetical protein
VQASPSGVGGGNDLPQGGSPLARLTVIEHDTDLASHRQFGSSGRIEGSGTCIGVLVVGDCGRLDPMLALNRFGVQTVHPLTNSSSSIHRFIRSLCHQISSPVRGNLSNSPYRSSLKESEHQPQMPHTHCTPLIASRLWHSRARKEGKGCAGSVG